MHEAGSEKEPGLELGETLQRALEARGIEIGLEETARLSAALLSLVRQGLIEPVEQKSRRTRQARAMTSPLDWMGNANLIHAAQAAGVEHFVLMSVRGAAPDHPIELFRMKYRAEQELLASKLAWTIIRPIAYLETWIMVVCKPLLKKGGTMVFGRGDNPINFVSVRDVAQFIELAVTDPALRGQPIEVGGPQNLTFKQFLEIFQTQTGASGAVRHVSRTASRLGSRVLRPINSMRAQQMGAAYFMDTADRTFDPSETMRRYPTFVPTPLTEVLARGTGGSNPPWKHLMPRRKSRSPRTCRCVWP